MAVASKFEILGEFIDGISPGLRELANESIPAVVGALAGLAVAFAIDKVSDMVVNAAKVGDEFAKLSVRTGIVVEELSGLSTIARLSDVSMSEMATSVRKLNDELAEASQDGSSNAALLFKQLGIEVKDANGKVKEGTVAIKEIADKFKDTADDGNKVAAAFDLMGKSGVQMITVLNGGSEAIEEMAQLTKELRLDWTTEQTKQAERFNDALEILKMAFEGVGAAVAKDLLPKLVLIAEYMADSAKEGGLLRAVLDGLVELITGPVGAALDFLATLASTIGLAFHAAGIAIGGTVAALNSLLSLDFAQAANIISLMGGDLKKLGTDYLEFNTKIWNPEAAKKGSEATKESIGTIAKKAKETAGEVESAFDKAFRNLQKELTTLDQTGKTSEIIYQTQLGSYKDFNEAQKEKLINLAREIDYHKLLINIMKQEQTLTAARTGKISNATIQNNAGLIADPKEKAGYVAAEQQAAAFNIYLDNQKEIAEKNADESTKKRLLAEIELKRELYNVNGRMYNQAKEAGQIEYDLAQKTQAYAEAIGNLKTETAQLTQAQAEYAKLLEYGNISQERYNQLIKETSREMEDIRLNSTEAGKALLEVVNTRRSMDDLKERMEALNEALANGTITAIEYKYAMNNLQQSYDSINPVHVVDQVEKIEDIMKSTTASFEGMFSDTIFNAIQGKFENLGDSVKNIMDRMVSNILAAQLQAALFGDLGSTPSGKTAGSTGLLGGIFSSIFGGFRAEGGVVDKGKAYVVGEKRPELFVPNVSGVIVPEVGQGGNNGSTQVNISISALDGADVMRVLGQRKKEIAHMVSTTNRTYNLRTA